MRLRNCIMLLCALCLFSLQASAQQTIATFAYCAIEPGMGCGCDPGSRVPFADGATSWCIFWDRNQNGPDAADELVPVGGEAGQGNFDCQPFNGLAYCSVEGGFFSDPVFVMQDPPPAPDQPVYYLKVSGPTCCWVSDTVRLDPGQLDFYFTADDFTCSSTPCPIGAAPTPVTDVVVSEDELCSAVEVTWAHNGENVSGFALYVYDSESSEYVFYAQVAANVRSAIIALCADGEVQIGVSAANGSQQATIVPGVGRTYQRHFDPANPYSIDSGEITMNLVSPLGGDLCSARLYFDFFSGGNFVQRMCEVTDPDHLTLMEVTCAIPGQVPDPDCFVVMHDSNTANILLDCGLTDTIFFVLDGDEAPELPREFTLQQNYPNPFNPSTMIEYTVPFDGDVELSVFNLVGQKVATLVEGKVGAGQHVVEWNAQRASTGMYFYRLQMGSQVLTRKMLLLK